MKYAFRHLLLGLLTIFACSSSALAADLKEIQQEIEQGKAILIDVREEDEWKEAHLEKAILVPGSEIASGDHNEKILAKLKAEAKPEQKIYCHCKSGGRAKLTARLLGKLGVEVIPITETYQEMLQAGFKPAEPK
ncbi:rhodanese-like domain-containing protein [Bremerella sp. JC817]|uniref:rhodanese-like domain-containing protein n=1 Tax=Bremerella sp. JC817 TaxID=3231756 RepID=UPI00345A9E12